MFEFFRYVIVGGIAFLVDAGMLVLGREVLFSGMRANTNLLLSTILGFIFGLMSSAPWRLVPLIISSLLDVYKRQM